MTYSQPHSSGPADAPWAHDLHESVTQTVPTPSVAPSNGQDRQKPPLAPEKSELPNRSFSGSRQLGNVQVRILLGGMTEPIIIAAIPVHQHTRLPHHRPPLRRDKPVRISIPHMPIRYIFPKVERSFIFIPRALRPNQQGFGRIRVRGSFNGGYAGFGPLSSRRTSVYAGSGYSPSIALSRRSSLAREMSADGIVSPAAASFPRQTSVVMEAGKPVVRLPPAAEQPQASNQQPMTGAVAPVSNLQPAPYTLPEKPSFTENRPTSLPIHHPKPERTLQVGDIESPASLDFNPPQPQQQQPFHQQVPMQIQPTSYQVDPNQYPHSRHPSHPSQRGTPLQQIPETAIHAQPFQPYPYQQPQGFYPQQFAPPPYYYPQQPGPAHSAAAAPFVPGQQYYYPPPMPQVQQAVPEDAPTQSQAVPYETGGMVYYYNPAELVQGAESNQQYPQMPYAAPPVGMGGMMTPPVQYFPPPQVYYPAQGPQQ